MRELGELLSLAQDPGWLTANAPEGFRRVVDVAEEFHKFTLIMREYADDLNDRFSERSEKYEQGKLLTQTEKDKMRSA